MNARAGELEGRRTERKKPKGKMSPREIALENQLQHLADEAVQHRELRLLIGWLEEFVAKIARGASGNKVADVAEPCGWAVDEVRETRMLRPNEAPHHASHHEKAHNVACPDMHN